MKDPLTNACCKKYPECKCDKVSSQAAKKMQELRFQEIAHYRMEPCEMDDCQDCCGEFVGHEYEDYHCLNCGAETDGSDAANRAHERSEGDR